MGLSAAADGVRLREGLIDPNNTASAVWADTAYRSRANEVFLAACGKVSRIHRKKPKGKPMPKATARANAVKSSVRVRIEHVFAEQKCRTRLFIRTIGRARADATILLANMAYNMKRWCWLERRAAICPLVGGAAMLWLLHPCPGLGRKKRRVKCPKG